MKSICAKSATMMVAMLIMTLSGCNDVDPTNSTESVATRVEALEQLSDEQKLLREKAVAAKEKLFQSLLDELTRSMMEKGPAKSIAICKQRAPEIAAQISAETGVKIGRTSFKLRNQANTPPDWATSFVKDKVDQEIAVELPNRALGLLLPIRLQAACTLCHGNDQQVMPEVKAAIVSNYREDEATGFSEGDLRGYFWIEAIPE